MYYKLNSEFRFTRKISDDLTIGLVVYINYDKKTYDFMQYNQEGLFPRENNTDTNINKAYFELALEVLEFIELELY